MNHFSNYCKAEMNNVFNNQTIEYSILPSLLQHIAPELLQTHFIHFIESYVIDWFIHSIRSNTALHHYPIPSTPGYTLHLSINLQKVSNVFSHNLKSPTSYLTFSRLWNTTLLQFKPFTLSTFTTHFTFNKICFSNKRKKS